MSNRCSNRQKDGDLQLLETDSFVVQDVNNSKITSGNSENRKPYGLRQLAPSLFVSKPGGAYHPHVAQYICTGTAMVKKLDTFLQREKLTAAEKEKHCNAATTTTETSTISMVMAEYSDLNLENIQCIEDKEARKEFERDVMKALSQTLSPRDDYETCLEKRIKKMRHILHLYNTEYHTLNLKIEDAERHWSTEKLTKEEQKIRFTKWDATMAEVLAELTEAELFSLKRGGFAGVSGNEVDYCLTQSKIIELEVDKKLTGNKEKGCVETYSLIDILERKDDEVGRFFPKGRYDSKTNKFHRIPQNIWSPFRNLLKRHGINYKSVDNDFKNALENNYTLPKGMLYCRLLLNIANLISYNDVNKSWSCAKMDEMELEKFVFKGVPFNRNGMAFKFPPKNVSNLQSSHQ